MDRFRLSQLIYRYPTFPLPVVIKEKIVQDPGQPRFQIGAAFELLASRQRPKESFLNQIRSIGRIFCQMKRHPVKMIEMSHGFSCESVACRARCFLVAGHGRILTNCGTAV